MRAVVSPGSGSLVQVLEPIADSFNISQAGSSVLGVVVPGDPPDTTPPTTDDADDLWHNHAVTVTLTAVDNEGGFGMGGGLAKTEYKVDAAASWTNGTMVIVGAPSDHSTDGVRTISYRCTRRHRARRRAGRHDALPRRAIGVVDGAWYRTGVPVTVAASEEVGESGVASVTTSSTAASRRPSSAPRSRSACPCCSTSPTRRPSGPRTGRPICRPCRRCASPATAPAPSPPARRRPGASTAPVYLSYRITDNLSPKAKGIKIIVKNSRGKTVNTFLPAAKNTGTWYRVKWVPRAKGTYRYSLYAKDLAGSAQRVRGSAKVVVR